MMTAVNAGSVKRNEAVLAGIFGPYIMSKITGPSHFSEKDKEEARKEQELYDIVDSYIEQA